MRSNDHEVLHSAAEWAEQGRRAVLVTVLSTFGGSPRPPGSMAVIREDGIVVGSVSGGCVEDDLVAEVVRGDFWQGDSAVHVRLFGADAEEQARYRLPCNNSLRVAIEAGWDAALLREALDEVRQQRTVLRTVRFRSGEAVLGPQAGQAFFSENESGFSVLLGPHYRALIIGASELGRYLANILVTLDFAVTVCDPRPEYADGWAVPGTEISREMPTELVATLHCDERTAILAVTHDLKLDDLTLLEALKTPAFYVGALGSHTTTQRRKERLRRYAVTEAELARLHGPIGLRIGSRTPAEIAVSIAAGLIEARRQQEGGATSPQCRASGACA